MTILGVIVLLVVLGFILWLLKAFIPMDEKTYKVLVVFIVVVALLIVINALGLLPFLDRPVPQIGGRH